MGDPGLDGRMILRWIFRKAGHVARMGERRGVYRGMVGKPEGKGTTWESQV